MTFETLSDVIDTSQFLAFVLFLESKNPHTFLFGLTLMKSVMIQLVQNCCQKYGNESQLLSLSNSNKKIIYLFV